ncbi:Reverse transcriptase domain and Zinc finger, CCHC-type domain and Peptidase A2A, retrovirus RVP subgroup domain and Aspartic peptidase domain-containing protein [Strongyloides ratti]|uniref:Reverse transcriptase domain and Zinc finger, CCHC-type domain and Peptidase A2A, retrovirus RVP subgroup domain and Aspartic peptidase domain-containing protein n=1 Tax=Strongyloides ratti TaxID=34506 RepID=A0A090KVP3_STRRB|nr:Reverse transcriptase domain and Zinc finger, CCHC-type domain and Peptidase A2A, retrovirus RVP subgroup domain and Aspartic peptidase domain-containing protein [Strongyloides ratti]CEF61575.1 Reverse transcriptase domain and Zinc finger, CCHC-type domain and Peptidase A2A, retrovirus RVP subgroup domain and Aspartic peptidase domain-containing protein [Strongyloides ratti]
MNNVPFMMNQIPMQGVLKPQYRLETYDDREPFSVYLEKFELICKLNNIPEQEKLYHLRLSLKGKAAQEVSLRNDIKNNFTKLVDYLLVNFNGSESIAAAKQKLNQIRSFKHTELTANAKEIARLIDVIYIKESPQERLERKRTKLAECVPEGIIRHTILHGRPDEEPFDKTVLVIQDLWVLPKNTQNNKITNHTSKEAGYDKRKVRKDIICNGCGKPGHYERECRTVKREGIVKEKEKMREANRMQVEPNSAYVEKSDTSFCKEPPENAMNKQKSNLPIIQATLNKNIEVSLLLDTGSEITILPKKFLGEEKLNLRNGVNVKTISDNKLLVYETLHPVSIKIGNQEIRRPIYVIENEMKNQEYNGILGMDIIKDIKISMNMKDNMLIVNDIPFSKGYTEEEVNILILDLVTPNSTYVNQLREEFKDIIAKDEFDLGEGKPKCSEIKLKEGATFGRPQNISVKESDKPILKEYLDKLEKANVIKKGISNFAQPIIIIIPKKDGRRRIIGDMREINKIVKPIFYSPPMIQQTIQKMSGCNYFSIIDCNNAYFQIGIPENSKQYLAVRTPYGTYLFNRLVQGYINSSAEFQRIAETFIEGFEDCASVYIDDTIIHTKGDIQHHFDIIKKILNNYRKNGIKISFNKCLFGGTSVKYLGYYINKDGCVPHDDNIRNFLSRPFPKNKKQLKGFVASANYFRAHIKNFA